MEPSDKATTFDRVVSEVAEDLVVTESTLREAFLVWINTPGGRSANLPSDLNAACYAVYRLVKAHDSFRMTSRSRRRWREVALGLGASKRLSANPVGPDKAEEAV